MKRISFVLLALTCAACAAGSLPVASGGVPVPVASAAAPINLQLAGLTFGLPTPDDLRAVKAMGFTGNIFLHFRPSVYGAISTARQLENGNFVLGTYFPSPFGEGLGVTSVLTARVPAPKEGAMDTYVQSTIQPIIQAWEGDAALFTAYVRMPNLTDLRAGITRSHDPNATANEAAIVKNVGWPLAYLSASRREALFFYASGVVLRAQWAPKRYTEQSVPISEAAAIKALVAALRDPAALCEEARTGRDHFLGIPYAGVFGPPEGNRHDDLVPTYDIPDAVDWRGSLNTDFADKPVWYVGSTWGGGGYVDALTGAVIRFTRMRVGHGTGGPPSPFVPPAP